MSFSNSGKIVKERFDNIFKSMGILRLVRITVVIKGLLMVQEGDLIK